MSITVSLSPGRAPEMLLLLVMLGTSAVRADCDKRPPCRAFWYSDVVFIGTCLEEDAVGRFALLSVEKTLRGNPGATALVATPSGFRKGLGYLVFGVAGTPPYHPAGSWVEGECDATMVL